MVINIIMNGYYNTIVRNKSDFKYWLDENMKDLGGEIIYKNKKILNRAYVIYFCDKVTNEIKSNAYAILDEKQLRNKIATLLYKISE
jgi:hypothetical protein